MNKIKFIAILGLLCITSLGLRAQKIEYTLSMSKPYTHYYEVKMNISSITTNYLDLKMATWAPGSYLIREFSKSVEAFGVTSSGQKIPFEPINKNTWKINTKGKKSIEITYKVYAFEMSVRTSFLDADHGYLNGTSVFMYIDKKTNLPSILTVIPFKDWKVVSTSLSEITGKKWKYTVPNFDILVDSPIEIGNHTLLNFEAAGVKHHIAMYGEAKYDKEQLLTDMKKVTEEATKIVGVNPNKEYLFIIHNLTKGSGGLEHLSSTTLQVNRWTYSKAGYQGFLGLVAHEYFHLWNVKRIRPITLGPFNYEAENYTHNLWVAEGITSYYDELMLKRAGYYTDEKYLEKLSNTISRIETQPGNKVQSAAESSFTAWTKAYRSNENSYNTTISYYPKGELISAMLDLEIINATNGKKKLDDVLRLLYNKYYLKSKRGYTDEELKKAFEEVLGRKLDHFFTNYIYGTKTIDYNHFLEYAGCKIEDENKDNTTIKMGVNTKTDGNKIVIRTVVRGTGAYDGGLNVNDEIIAVDGVRVTSSNWQKIIDSKAVEDIAEIMISRDNHLKTLKIKLTNDYRKKYKLSRLKNLTDHQKMVYNKWLE